MSRSIPRVALHGAALAAALSGLALLLLACGYSPPRAAWAFFEGAFGDVRALTLTLLKATPLLWTGLGVALAFRVGVWNIGAEGQFYVGALAATWVGTSFELGFLHPLAAMAAGALAGLAWGGLAAVLKIRFGVSEILSTIMLNFIAIDLVGYVVHGPLKEVIGSYPRSERLLPSARLVRIFDGNRLHLGVLLALAAALLLYILLRWTRTGFRLRAVGCNPEAAEVAGISPGRQMLLGLALSGALAGAGGASEVQGVTGRLYERFSAGYGYTAIAVALLGGLHPGGVVLASLFFGSLEAGAGHMQRFAGTPSVMVTLVQGLVLLYLLATGLSRPVDARAREPG